MKAHVSSILLGVQDMDRSKRFYAEGLGWEVQNDYKISVFFVPHDGEPTESGRDQRRELGAVFLRQMLRVAQLSTSSAAP